MMDEERKGEGIWKGEDIWKEKLIRFLKIEGINPDWISPLTPDASSRRYFRLHFKDGFMGKKTVIAMVMGEMDKAIIFEEIIEKQVEFSELPFINIGRFLRKNGIMVPEIYLVGYDVILVEDFGSMPLDVFVKMHGFDKADIYYEDAIGQLIRLQSIKDEPQSCYAYSLNFSRNMLMWEFEHFIENFMETSPTPEMKKEFEEISDMLSKSEYVLTHRDYHSKNLMCLDNKVGIIDFQDALLGPYMYDLVSLTCDAYVDIPEELEDHLIAKYIEGRKINHFQELYSACAVQRTLKAAGRFLYIYKKKRNPKFLPYVIPAVKKGIAHMRRLKLKSTDIVSEKADYWSKKLKDLEHT